MLSVVPEEKRRVLEARMTSSKDSNAVVVGTVVGFGGEGSSKDGITTSGESLFWHCELFSSISAASQGIIIQKFSFLQDPFLFNGACIHLCA